MTLYASTAPTTISSVGLTALEFCTIGTASEHSFHYALPGIEDVWGLGDTEVEAITDLRRKIRRIRAAMERVW